MAAMNQLTLQDECLMCLNFFSTCDVLSLLFYSRLSFFPHRLLPSRSPPDLLSLSLEFLMMEEVANVSDDLSQKGPYCPWPLTPLERFLFGEREPHVSKKPTPTEENKAVLSTDANALCGDPLGAIVVLPTGVLLDEFGFCEGFVGGNDKEVGEGLKCPEGKGRTFISSSSGSYAANVKLVKGQWTAEEDRYI